MFAKSAQALVNNNSQMISIKITGLVDMGLLKRMNDSVVERNKFWKENSLNEFITGQQIFQGLQKKYSGISDGQFSKYLKDIHNYTGDPRQVNLL